MKYLVITGAHGYIGSALVKKLAAEGHALRLVSRSSQALSAETGPLVVQYIQADLRDEASWCGLLDDAAAIVHLSWRTDLHAAESDPGGDRDLNVEPVRVLVRAAERCGVALPVVFASTVTIVGAQPPIPADETVPNQPCSVYDQHKLVCETILREATARGAIRACSLRLSNVYGYGGASINANRGVLNVMLKRALAGEPLTLFGDGAYVRDYTHLDDVVEAFRLAIAAPSIYDGQYYVIASGQGHSLAEAYALIAEAAREHAGRHVEIRRVPEPPDLQPIEKRNFVGNSQLFRKRTGWCPRFDLKAGIRDYFVRAVSRPAMAVGR